MASATLPPRQKMINMMYLVLTAILALNVSKEVLDSFAVMDSELRRSGDALEQRNAVEYATFADAAARLPEKFARPFEQALRLKIHADSLIHHIERIKVQAMAEADGVPQESVRGQNAEGKDTLLPLMALEAKDDREVLTRMMVGSEPASPTHEPGGAYDLRLRITAFRDSLKAITGSRAPELSAALDHLFDLGDRRDASGTMNNWESTNFYDIPLAAGVATLSKLQTDIRSSENDVLKHLFRSVESKDHKFGTITTAVIPQSTLIMLGDSFRADVFLAAYDPRNRPTVTIENGTTAPVGSDGKAKLRSHADQIGERTVQGSVTFEGPDGKESLPFMTSYQVMAPLLVASPTKMNVLFRGVDNPVDISVPGVPADRVQATISSGRIERQGNGWVAKGMTGNNAEVYASITQADGSVRRIGPVIFRVKELPPPTAYISGTEPLSKTAPKGKLAHAQGIIAKPLDALFDDPWKVQRFDLTIIRVGGNAVFFSATGNAFDAKMLAAMAAVRPNDQVYVDGIRARLASGAGPIRDLPPIVLKVVP